MQTTENVNKKDVQSVPVATRITKPMHRAVLILLNVDAHLNVADYLRDLIRKDLENKGVFYHQQQEVSTGE